MGLDVLRLALTGLDWPCLALIGINLPRLALMGIDRLCIVHLWQALMGLDLP